MKIILITETLHAGGAETFVVRLANALAFNHEVILVNIYPHASRKGLINQVSKNVTLINLRFPMRTVLSKIDALIYRGKIDWSCMEVLIRIKLTNLIRYFKPSVIHTHLFKPDYYVSSIRKKIKFRFNHVTTNHGDYLSFEFEDPVRLLKYQKKLHQTLTSIDSMVVISDDQKNWAFKQKEKRQYQYSVFKIFNGYSVDAAAVDRKSEIHLNESDFVYGMVARGIKQKGWHNLIKAFNKLDINNKKLLLVGEGLEIDHLKKIYKNENKIIFVGYSSRPLEYIKLFDVGIFTSYSLAESLPTVIIEYLACNKPLIATEIGEVKEMLQTHSNETAGLLIEFDRDGVDDEGLFKKMQTLYLDDAVRNKLINLTKDAFLKFDMKRCVHSYLKVYSENTY